MAKLTALPLDSVFLVAVGAFCSVKRSITEKLTDKVVAVVPQLKLWLRERLSHGMVSLKCRLCEPSYEISILPIHTRRALEVKLTPLFTKPGFNFPLRGSKV